MSGTTHLSAVASTLVLILCLSPQVGGECWSTPVVGHVKLTSNTTAIPASAFSECGELVSIEIPASVSEIGDNAFYKCTNLSSVTWADINVSTVPNSRVIVGKKAFYGCQRLNTIVLPARTSTIGDSAFARSGINAITIPQNVSAIADKLFQDCDRLREITIQPENRISSVGVSAFEGCIKLGPAIVIPDTVVEIGRKAFSTCSALSSIEIPNTVKTIGEAALPSCFGFGLSSNDTVFQRHGIVHCLACAGVTRLVVPGSVTAIGDYAFAECSDVTSVVLPNSLTSIGHEAFQNAGLEHVSLPNSLEIVGTSAFEGCRHMSTIFIPTSVRTVGEGALPSCYGYGISIAGLVQPRGQVICLACAGTAELNIPSNVTAVGDAAFKDCETVVSVNIPSSVVSVGDKAFQGIGCPDIDPFAYQPGITLCDCHEVTSFDWPCSVTATTSLSSALSTNATNIVTASTRQKESTTATATATATLPNPPRPTAENVNCYVTSNWTVNQTGFIGNGGYVT